jgi:hypothetical protein
VCHRRPSADSTLTPGISAKGNKRRQTLDHFADSFSQYHISRDPFTPICGALVMSDEGYYQQPGTESGERQLTPEARSRFQIEHATPPDQIQQGLTTLGADRNAGTELGGFYQVHAVGW